MTRLFCIEKHFSVSGKQCWDLIYFPVVFPPSRIRVAEFVFIRITSENMVKIKVMNGYVMEIHLIK